MRNKIYVHNYEYSHMFLTYFLQTTRYNQDIILWNMINVLDKYAKFGIHHSNIQMITVVNIDVITGAQYTCRWAFISEHMIKWLYWANLIVIVYTYQQMSLILESIRISCNL